MTFTAGLVLQGDEKKNALSAHIVTDENGNRLFYNVIQAGEGNDSLEGASAIFGSYFKKYGTQLFGEGGNDRIEDSTGTDTLSGGEGDDYIISRAGRDIIDGGDGFDTLELTANGVLTSDSQSISGIEKLVFEYDTYRIADFDLTAFEQISPGGNLLIFTQATSITDVNFNSGNWHMRVSAFSDLFDVSNSPGSFIINAGNGDDRIIGGQGHNNLYGESGDDRLKGGETGDTIEGGGGNDIITGGGGDDLLRDTSGDNTIHGGSGNDGISALGGHNIVYGDSGNDIITLNKGTAVVYGGDGDDTMAILIDVRHNTGHWTVHGGKGEDTLSAEGNLSNLTIDGVERLSLYGDYGKLVIAANVLDSFDAILNISGHTLQLSTGGDFTWKPVAHQHDTNGSMIGSKDRDTIDLTASQATWTVNGGGGDDVISIGQNGQASLRQNWLLGGKGNDTLVSGASWDILSGGAGNDLLIGSGGTDKFTGGHGKDTFVFATVRGQTEITDFTAHGASQDVIDLSAVNGLKGFDDIIDNHSNQDDGGLVIWVGKNNIILDGITAQDLHASNFIF